VPSVISVVSNITAPVSPLTEVTPAAAAVPVKSKLPVNGLNFVPITPPRKISYLVF